MSKETWLEELDIKEETDFPIVDSKKNEKKMKEEAIQDAQKKIKKLEEQLENLVPELEKARPSLEKRLKTAKEELEALQ